MGAGHTLIIGKTMSGKTTFAEKLAKDLNKNGFRVLVLTPSLMVNDSRWQGWASVTSDPKAFVAMAKANEKLLLVVDEAGHWMKDDDVVLLPTYIRHKGSLCFFIGQKYTSIKPTVRENCTQIALFECSATYAKMMADDFNAPELLEAPSLKPGICIYKATGERGQKIKVF